MNDTNLQIQEAQWSPSRINLKQTAPRHVLKYPLPHLPSKKKIKKKILKKKWRKEYIVYRRTTTWITFVFYLKQPEARK